GSSADLAGYRTAVDRIPKQIEALRVLTRDNKAQRENCEELESITNARLKDWEAAVETKSQGKIVDLADVMQQSLSLSSQSATVGEAIRTQEMQLLLQRTLTAQRQFFIASIAVVTSFVFAILLLYLHYRLLTSELYAREEA